MWVVGCGLCGGVGVGVDSYIRFTQHNGTVQGEGGKELDARLFILQIHDSIRCFTVHTHRHTRS